jgi:hypothetical protein
VNRYAKKKLGDAVIKIWNNTTTTRTPATANRAAMSTDWVADVQDIKGYKEAALTLMVLEYLENCSQT